MSNKNFEINQVHSEINYLFVDQSNKFTLVYLKLYSPFKSKKRTYQQMARHYYTTYNETIQLLISIKIITLCDHL